MKPVDSGAKLNLLQADWSSFIEHLSDDNFKEGIHCKAVSIYKEDILSNIIK